MVSAVTSGGCTSVRFVCCIRFSICVRFHIDVRFCIDVRSFIGIRLSTGVRSSTGVVETMCTVPYYLVEKTIAAARQVVRPVGSSRNAVACTLAVS